MIHDILTSEYVGDQPKWTSDGLRMSWDRPRSSCDEPYRSSSTVESPSPRERRPVMDDLTALERAPDSGFVTARCGHPSSYGAHPTSISADHPHIQGQDVVDHVSFARAVHLSSDELKPVAVMNPPACRTRASAPTMTSPALTPDPSWDRGVRRRMWLHLDGVVPTVLGLIQMPRRYLAPLVGMVVILRLCRPSRRCRVLTGRIPSASSPHHSLHSRATSGQRVARGKCHRRAVARGDLRSSPTRPGPPTGSSGS